MARLMGTEIRVHLSWTLIAAFLVASLGAVDLPGQNPGWSGSVSWAVAIAAGAGFFASVLLHELAHLAVGRRAHASPASVTLLLFGGVSPAERGARTAAWEAAIAIAGPAASLGLGFAAWFQHRQHALLTLRQHHVVGRHIGFALRHLVEVDDDARAALVRHLG